MVEGFFDDMSAMGGTQGEDSGEKFTLTGDRAGSSPSELCFQVRGIGGVSPSNPGACPHPILGSPPLAAGR